MKRLAIVLSQTSDGRYSIGATDCCTGPVGHGATPNQALSDFRLSEKRFEEMAEHQADLEEMELIAKEEAAEGQAWLEYRAGGK